MKPLTKRAAAAAAIVILASLLVVAGGAFRQHEAAALRTDTVKLERLKAHRDYYRNMAEPLVAPETSADVELVPGRDGNGAGKAAGGGDKALSWQVNRRKGGNGFPLAAKQLAKLEADAVRTGQNPRQIKQAKGTNTAKLLTIIAEFNENAKDDFSGWSRPFDYVDGGDCVTEPAGTLLSGPRRNEIPDPATTPGDNYSFWAPDFTPQHYAKMLYTTDGLTQQIRTDLNGGKGFNFRGRTMKNMYREMSHGAYDITGEVLGWVKVDHSEAWYGADSCAGGGGSDVGHPDNPNGESQLVIDAVNKFAAANPGFAWANYDVEDVADADGDGNFNEPDGIIDHFVVVHAGSGEEGAGGAEGTYAIWSSASAVSPATGGYTIPGTSLKVLNYIMQPEDGAVGVFAHEFGHDLGLPDWYDTSGGGDSDVDFWDLMSSGSHSGELNQLQPTHMGAWDKFVLGWTDPLILAPGKDARDVQLGQQSNPPVGTKDAIRVNLPTKVVTLAEPHSGADAWWTNNDQDWADVKLARTVAVPAGSDVKFRFWTNYVVEADWDFDFVEVSTNGGSSWTQLKIYNANGTLASTNDGYADPNGRLHDYGDLKYGLTGDSHGWKDMYVDLAAYAGSTIGLRIRHATDAGFLERGAFYDDFRVTNGTAVAWADDTEGASDWTTVAGTFVDTSGAGFVQHSGTFNFNQYFLAEWRNFDGFDNGLKYAYDTSFFNTTTGAWHVTFTPYNAPGLLVWYRDIQYGTVNHVTVPTFSGPSIGSKGGLLIVDSHFDPVRRDPTTTADKTTTKNMPSRAQSSNAAFNTFGTYPFTECIQVVPTANDTQCTPVPALAAAPSFSDGNAYYPGIERRVIDGKQRFFFRDNDASVVLPSLGNAFYTTRLVDQDGNPYTPLFGIDLFGTGSNMGTGEPSKGNNPAAPVDLSHGVTMTVTRTAKDNSYATISVVPVKP